MELETEKQRNREREREQGLFLGSEEAHDKRKEKARHLHLSSLLLAHLYAKSGPSGQAIRRITKQNSRSRNSESSMISRQVNACDSDSEVSGGLRAGTDGLEGCDGRRSYLFGRTIILCLP